jgi:hypothetical protein
MCAGLRGYKNATYKKNLIYTSRLILKRIAEAAETISQQPDIFERTSQSLLCRHQLCIEVNGHTFEHLVSIGNKLQLFSDYYSGFALFPTSVGPTLFWSLLSAYKV